MTKRNIVLLVIGALFILGVLYIIQRKNTQQLSDQPTTETATTSSSTGVTKTNDSSIPTTGKSPTSPSKTSTAKLTPTKNTQVYSNMAYGFSVRYPKGAIAQTPFSGFYSLGTDWRVNATGMYRGTPVVSFIVKRIDNQYTLPKSYPPYFTAETRIGVTPDTTNCYAKDEGYTNQVVTNITLNGVAFKKFSFGDAGMMKYQQGESYRTIHNKQCYVIEQIRAGSSYRDETMKIITPESTLSDYYISAGDIAKSFVFTK